MTSKERTTKPKRSIFAQSTGCFILVSVSMLMLTGCATVFSVSEYPVNIDSAPSKMEIVVTDSDGNIVFRGQTPAVVDLEAGGGYFVRETYTIELYDAGKVVGSTTIKGSIDPWYFANLFRWGLIGLFVVDPMTGAMWTLKEDVTVYRDVATLDATSSPQLRIVSIDDIPEEHKENLIALRPNKETAPESEQETSDPTN